MKGSMCIDSTGSDHCYIGSVTDISLLRMEISLRWIYEQGASMVVKSWKQERLKENTEIFDWELSDEDRFKISQMPQHKMARVTGILCPEGVSSVDITEVDVVEI